MPAEQRGQVRRLPSGRWQLRYYDNDGVRQSAPMTFATKSKAHAYFRDVIEPMLRGEVAAVEHTLAEFVPIYLERRTGVRERTVTTLRERLRHAEREFGDVPLRELERMTDEIAAWHSTLPERSRYGIMQAFRQTLGAARRWGHMSSNPAVDAGPNRQPPPRAIRAYTVAEVDAIAAELSAPYRSLPAFGSATGLRPEEWAALERRDVDRRNRTLSVRRTVSGGKRKDSPLVVVELAKTSEGRRQVPLSGRALAALDAMPTRLDTPLLFPSPAGGLLNLDNFRRREWGPAIEAGGIATPARIYDMRSTFASNAIAARVPVFVLARIMGTSVRMIERHYGVLLDGASADLADHLTAFEAEQDRDAEEGTDEGTR
jgi:integrase